MENPEKDNQDINANEDEISAQNADALDTATPADDSFKSSTKKHRLGWEVPQDEQQFDAESLRTKED